MTTTGRQTWRMHWTPRVHTCHEIHCAGNGLNETMAVKQRAPAFNNTYSVTFAKKALPRGACKCCCARVLIAALQCCYHCSCSCRSYASSMLPSSLCWGFVMKCLRCVAQFLPLLPSSSQQRCCRRCTGSRRVLQHLLFLQHNALAAAAAGRLRLRSFLLQPTLKHRTGLLRLLLL